MKKRITVFLAALIGLVFCGCSSPATGHSNISDFYKDFNQPLPPGPVPFPAVQFGLQKAEVEK